MRRHVRPACPQDAPAASSRRLPGGADFVHGGTLPAMARICGERSTRGAAWPFAAQHARRGGWRGRERPTARTLKSRDATPGGLERIIAVGVASRRERPRPRRSLQITLTWPATRPRFPAIVLGRPPDGLCLSADGIGLVSNAEPDSRWDGVFTLNYSRRPCSHGSGCGRSPSSSRRRPTLGECRFCSHLRAEALFRPYLSCVGRSNRPSAVT